MQEIQFTFTPGDNVKSLPKPISGKYELVKLEITAESLTGLVEAVRGMRIYFRFDYGSTYHNFTASYHLSKYIVGMDSLNYTIDFNEKVLEITSSQTCTNASVAILEDVLAPVLKMTLTLIHIESE